MKNEIFVLIFFFLAFFIFTELSFAEVSIVCSNCVPNDCQCVSNCSNGTLYVYSASTCSGIFTYSYVFTNGVINWQPSAGTYSLKVLCDDGNQSSCSILLVIEPPITTTTTMTTGGGGGGGGGAGGCVNEGSYCFYSSQCFSNLNFINNKFPKKIS